MIRPATPPTMIAPIWASDEGLKRIINVATSAMDARSLPEDDLKQAVEQQDFSVVQSRRLGRDTLVVGRKAAR